MENLICEYIRFKEEKAKFEVYQEINPKDAMYKLLLHRLRDHQEDLVDRCEEILLLDHVKRIFEAEKELILEVDLR